MAGGLYSKATEIAVLSGARLPSWTEAYRGDVLSALPSGGDGIALESRVVAHVAADLRYELDGRSAWISVAILDLLATYAITIDGVACSYDAAADGAATLGDVLAGLAAEIATTAAAVVTVTADTANGEIRIKSLASYGMAIQSFSASGTGELAVEAEALSMDLELYTQYTGLAGWRLAASREVTWKGLAESFPIPGMSRAALRALNLSGASSDAGTVTLVPYRVALGPCRLEPFA